MRNYKGTNRWVNRYPKSGIRELRSHMVNVSCAVHRGIAVVEVIQSRLNGRG